MADLASLQIALELNAASFQRGVDQALNQMGRMEAKSKSIDAQMKAFGKTLAGVVSVGVVVAGFQRIVDAMDDMSKAAAKTGVAAEELQRLAHAADMAGVPFETLQTALGRLSVGMTDMNNQSSEIGQALRKIGVDAGGTTTEALGKLADRFAAMPDGAQKTAEAIKIFGKAGAQMIPVLNGGSAGIKEMADEADRLGIVLSGDVLLAAEAFNDNMSRLSKATGGIGKSIVAGLLPALNAVTNAMVDSAKSGDAWKELGTGLGQVFAWVSIQAIALAGTVQAVGKGIGALAAVVANPTQAGSIFKAWIADVDELDRKAAAAIKKINDDLAAGPSASGGKPSRNPTPVFGGDKAAASKAEAAVRAYKTEIANLELELIKLGGTMTRVEEYTQRVDLGLIAATGPQQENIKLLLARIDAMNELAAAEQRNAESLRVASDARNKAIDEEERFLQSILPVTTALEEYEGKLLRIQGLLAAGTITQTQYIEAMVAMGERTKEVGDKAVVAQDSMQQAMKNLAVQGVGGLADSFLSADKGFKEFAANFLKSIAKMIIQTQILNALKNSSFGGFLGLAKGGAFGGATGLPYGVYNQPTFFKMPGSGPLQKFARGGVLGEAGPEAIMPLRRTGSGRLGVETTGSSAPVVNVYNNANATVSTKQNSKGELDIFIDAVVGDIARGGGRISAAMQRTYGLNRTAGAY